VYFLGTLTRNPEVRSAPNGMAVARYGVAVPTRLRHGDTWHTDVCRIEVVAFGPQAAMVGAALRQDHDVLIEGRLQRRRWVQEGQYRRTREVIAERIQCLSHPRADVLEGAGGGALRDVRNPVQPLTYDALRVPAVRGAAGLEARQRNGYVLIFQCTHGACVPLAARWRGSQQRGHSF
jgi:single-strand DNA-binding protein